MILYQAKAVEKDYISGDVTLPILKGIDLSVNKGEMTAIVGASGSGKTTLLQVLGTLSSPNRGALLFKGDDLCCKSEKELAAFRNASLGFIFQAHHLLPEFTALENVMMPALIAGKSRKKMIEPAQDLLEKVELDHRTTHKINELSGGEQQRVALARALIMQPEILLADEPTGNLDSRTGDIVFKLLQKLCQDLSLSILMVTHNTVLADKMNHCYTLKDGQLSL